MAAKWALVWAAAISLGVAVTGCRDSYGASDAEPAETVVEQARYVETREVITRLANELMRANEVTGISLALVDGDEVVWATGFGLADVNHRISAGPRTVYNVGSLAKPVTVAAVLQAVERGELSLDQTLAELLPELDLAGDAEQEITLSQLITHQSGLPSDWFVHSLSHDPPPWTEIVAEINGLELAQAPGTLTLYSNLGMSLAGAALERASARSYEQVVSEALLRPAGMRTAYFPGGPEPEPVLLPIHDGPRGLAAIELAAAYRQQKTRRDPEFRLVPAGGLHASVLDLAAFASLILGEGRVGGKQLLAPESVAAMLAPHNDALALDLDSRFGYGWFLDHSELDWAGRVAWHSGRTYYHHSRLILLPDHGLAVAIASNSLTAGSVVDILAVEALVLALQEKHGLEAPFAPAKVGHHAAEPSRIKAFAQAHAGDYATGIGVSSLAVEDGELWSRAAVGRSRLTIDSDDGGTAAYIVGTTPGVRVRFIDEGEHHLMFIAQGEVRRRAGVRLDRPVPIPAAWRARTGRWKTVHRPGEVSTQREPTLHIEGGRLRIEFLGLLEHPPVPVIMALEPLDDRRARIEGLSRGQGTILEIRGEGDGERLWWSGWELARDN